MIRPAEFSELVAFAAVATERSFRRAATRLGLRPSTLSHAVRALEQRYGVRLLARTTRSVTATEAGELLLRTIEPALAALAGASAVADAHRAAPRGRLRLTVPQTAARTVLAPRLGPFARDFPDVELDISVDDGLVDIVRDGYDAGIRLGESVAPGMTAIRVGPDLRAAVIAAPSYWAAAGRPAAPRELARHRCIGRRYGKGRDLHRWEFARGAHRLEIDVRGSLIVDSEALMRRAALDGAGVAMLEEGQVAADVEAGRLERVLADWCPPVEGFFLYHPSSRLPSASLRALIDTLRVGSGSDPDR